MPFTLSHPAAVIPIRKYGVLSALVVGSMMPDTLYFMPVVGSHDWYGHTLPGIFFYCLPAGLAFLWLFHAFLKGPLISLFPEVEQRKLQAAAVGFRFAPMRRFAALAFSILMGAASHVTWDAFTHTSQFGVQLFPVLRTPVRIPPHSVFSIADLLQLGSSVFGLAVIFFYYRRWLRTAEQSHARIHLPASARVILVLIFAAGVLAPMIVSAVMNPAFLSFKRMWIGYGAMAGIKVMCVELFIFCVAWHIAFGGRTEQRVT
jgi:uncharacterized protein DUF4184